MYIKNPLKFYYFPQSFRVVATTYSSKTFFSDLLSLSKSKYLN